MAPKIDDDWSDSDDEALADVETAVLLGVPDGPIESGTDLTDAAVSRIGGHPVRYVPLCMYRSRVAISCSTCENCSTPMELLVQIWCPFEDSPHDRALYVWACARGSCQKKAGSVRAWRGLRHNEQYAIKLEKKLAQRKVLEKARADAAAKEEEKKIASKTNPFSMQSSTAPNPFTLGSQLFGSVTPAETTKPTDRHEGTTDDGSDAESEAAASSTSEESLITALATTTLEESPWASAPSYPPLYLSTISEYVPPPPKSKIPAGTLEDNIDDERKDGKGANWAVEAYENSLEVDQVFERFTKRVGYEGEQCVRYELKGVPLPFASDKVLDAIFPMPPAEPLPVTKPDFKVVPVQKRTYDPSSLSTCSLCKSKRVFECQLMPNLINVLRSGESEGKKLTDEERRKAVELELKGGDNVDRKGMEWGTCLIFSCEKDCCIDDKGEFEARECWREELVLVQWDE